MLELLTYIPFVVAVFLVFCILFSLHKTRNTSQFIKSDKLGIIERDLVNLVQVVVVAHTVEMPTSTLLKAVEANFLREVPVKYLFLISQSQGDNALSGYFKMFTAIAEIALAKREDNLDPVDYVKIKRLSYDWTTVPYIFYQCADKDSSLKRTITFRGNQKCEGIANYYKQVSSASVMAQAILSGAPEEIFKDTIFTDKIITYPRRIAQALYEHTSN
ncbi:MAG: hypothetical protein KAV87_15065 [Desulfobacteraceae bacterium]|nr:hypothetical protein [Desulfobacteraceae bacterium]